MRAAWRDAVAVMEEADLARPDLDLVLDSVLQRASERAFQRGLVAELAGAAATAPSERKSVQAAFCIDVRSKGIGKLLR